MTNMSWRSLPLFDIAPMMGLPQAISITWLYLGAAAWIGAVVVYRLWLHPLAHIPGPPLARITTAWLFWQDFRGISATAIHAAHQKYGPLVRIAPWHVDAADGAAIPQIYSGLMPKADTYKIFWLDKHETIFATSATSHRAWRAKAVAPLFTNSALEANKEVLQEQVNHYVKRFKRDRDNEKSVELISVSRSLALDTVSAHLFGKRYGALDEKPRSLSIYGFLEYYVDAGGFSYLPRGWFQILDKYLYRYSPAWIHAGFDTVDKITRGATVRATEPTTDPLSTFPARLYNDPNVDLSLERINAECKDLVFAGVDTTGFSLSTLTWRLARHPEVYAKLKKSVQEAGPGAAPDKIPYLAAIVREGMRCALATPTRLARIVPKPGCHLNGTFVPAGTTIGCSTTEVQMQESVYPNARHFDPDRWMGDVTPEMNRNWFAFGHGIRKCIAQNLALHELHNAVYAIAEHDLLLGAKAETDVLEYNQWFNNSVRGHKIVLKWD